MAGSRPKLLRPRTCATCPFRGGFFLDSSGRQEIYTSVAAEDKTFSCHSEVDYDNGNDEGDAHNSSQCAGATTIQIREGSANQVMRWAIRFRGEEHQEDPEVPFSTWAEWINEPHFAASKSDEEGTGEPCSVVGETALTRQDGQEGE